MYIYIYMEMLQGTPCRVILNKQKYPFFKKEQEGKISPVWDRAPVRGTSGISERGGRYKERLEEAEYGESIMYSCVKMLK
jgi:hypothetical protein